MYLIAGLGNPGEKYAATRHNMGFSAIDYISQKEDIKVNKIKFKGLIGEGTVGGEKIALLKPQTFMNLSGESIRAAADWYKVKEENIIIIYDDISLPVGTLRIRKKGSAGGHNGIKSIILNMNSDVFTRIKIGVGANEDKDLKDYVLGKISKQEAEILFKVMDRVYMAVKEIIRADVKSAMNRYNGAL